MKKNTSKKKAVNDSLDDVPEMDEAFVSRFLEHIESAPKKAISLRLDPLVYKFFKSYGKGYQKRIHAVLKAFALHNM